MCNLYCLLLSAGKSVALAVPTRVDMDIDLFESDRLFLINEANITNNGVFINHWLMDVGDKNAPFFFHHAVSGYKLKHSMVYTKVRLYFIWYLIVFMYKQF